MDGGIGMPYPLVAMVCISFSILALDANAKLPVMSTAFLAYAALMFKCFAGRGFVCRCLTRKPFGLQIGQGVQALRLKMRTRECQCGRGAHARKSGMCPLPTRARMALRRIQRRAQTCLRAFILACKSDLAKPPSPSELAVDKVIHVKLRQLTASSLL